MLEVGSHLVRGGQGQRRAVEENRMSAKAEVKPKVYNFKMFNLQKSFLKILLKTRNSSSSLASRKAWAPGSSGQAVLSREEAGLHTGTTQLPGIHHCSPPAKHADALAQRDPDPGRELLAGVLQT